MAYHYGIIYFRNGTTRTTGKSKKQKRNCLRGDLSENYVRENKYVKERFRSHC